MKRKKKPNLRQPEDINRAVQLRDIKLDKLLDELLSAMEDVGPKTRMSLFRAVLIRLLDEYISVAEVRPRQKARDLMSTFCHSTSQVKAGEDIDQKVSKMIDLIKKDKRESFFRPVISRLVCMYAVFAKSDEEGVTKCTSLAKDLISRNNKPELLVLSTLKQRVLRRGEQIPFDERELLQKYTFWFTLILNKKRSPELMAPFFIYNFLSL